MAANTVTNIARGSVPYDHAHEATTFMFDVLALIYAAADMNDTSPHYPNNDDGLSSVQSNISNLLMQARDKIAAAIKRLDV